MSRGKNITARGEAGDDCKTWKEDKKTARGEMLVGSAKRTVIGWMEVATADPQRWVLGLISLNSFINDSGTENRSMIVKSAGDTRLSTSTKKKEQYIPGESVELKLRRNRNWGKCNCAK